MASDEVAAGDGAFRTFSTAPLRVRLSDYHAQLVGCSAPWRQPIRQATRCPARRSQEAQQVGQARPHGRNGLASQSTLAQKEARHVPHAERREIIDAHLDQVAQEPADRPVFRDHGRLRLGLTASAVTLTPLALDGIDVVAVWRGDLVGRRPA